MYPNLKAELARKNITLEKLSKALEERGIYKTIQTLSNRINGKCTFTLDEAKAIKEILGTDIPIDILFEEV
jgi:transcriptional regulator with XRE-family HTH domain